MNIRCPNCQTTFRVDPARVPAAGIRARCARCSATFRVTRDGADAGAPAARPPATAPEAGTSQATRPAAPQPEAAPAAQARPEPAAPHATAATTPAPATPAAQPAEPRQADDGRAQSVTDPAGPATGAQAGSADAPAAQPSQAARPEPPAQPLQASQATPTAQATQGSQAAQGSQPAASGAGESKAAFKGDSSPGRSGATVFGSRDPNARAQRIARALVSDIVAYHPKRRDASLEAGTLRTDFREEIMKSWEEYVAQVGLDMAKSTPYFRDALNAILARGQAIF